MGDITMKKFKRNVLLSLLAILCVPVTALAVKTAGDSALAETVPVEGGTATEAVVGQVTLDSFAMQDGAQVRKTTPTGIRFLTDISSADLAKLPENAQFGTLIIPETVLGENTLEKTTENVMDLKAKVWKETGATNVFTGVLVGAVSNGAETDFPVAYYNEPIVARSYVTYTDSQENEYTVYATNGQTRSVAYVASKALAENETDENGTLKNIVDTVIGDGFSVTSNKTILFTGDSAYQLAVNGDQGLFVDFQSSNDQIVDVTDDGKVTGIAAGEATVTATLGSVSYEFKFKVSAPIAQDSDWNIVSEENLANGAVAYYTNNPGTWSSGVTYGNHQNVSIDLLSETNAVGGRTSGIYYKVDPVANFAQYHRFVLKASQEKSVYEAMLANGATKNSYLQFDVYFDVLSEDETVSPLLRRYTLNQGEAAMQAAGISVQDYEEKWLTFTTPLSALVSNWDLIHTPAASDNKDAMSIFMLNGTFSGESTETNFWIGNFEVVYMPDYDVLETAQDKAWNTVHPNNLTDGDVYWMCNNAGGWMNGVTTEGKSNVTVTAATAKKPIGGKTEGAFYRVEPSSSAWYAQQNAFVLRPSQAKSVYEAYSANAVLKFDYYFEFHTVYETPSTMPYMVHGVGANVQASEKVWYTIEIPVATLVENYDVLKTTSTEVAWKNTYLIAINGNYRKNNGVAITDAWTAYIGNFRIVDPDIAS